MLQNAKLKNLFKLSSKVTLYIPSTVNINEDIDNRKYIDEAASLLSRCFGGATSCQTLGYWMSPSAGLVKERTVMVYAYCTDEDLQKHAEEVIDYCERLKKELKQDSIAMEINGEMYFI